MIGLRYVGRSERRSERRRGVIVATRRKPRVASYDASATREISRRRERRARNVLLKPNSITLSGSNQLLTSSEPDVCQLVSDVASRRHLRSAGRRLLNVPQQRRSSEYICPAGFLCGRPVGVELVAGLPERPGSQQRHFLQAPKDVFVCSVLIYVQRIRGFTTMRYINLRFTYLLTTY